MTAQAAFAFDGITYDAKRDFARLNAQARRVAELMSDGKWRTLAAISQETGDPEASVSARLRDLRKEQNGGFNIEREYVDRGLWKYRMGRV
jgi:hypothetical protein